MKFELDIKEFDSFFYCIAVDLSCQYQLVVKSQQFTDIESKRSALKNFYENISQVLRQRQFPNDSLVFEKEGQFAICKGYPEESK